MALVRCPRALRLRRLAQSLRRGVGLRRFHCKFLHKRALVEILLHSFQRDPCVIGYWPLAEDLVGALVRSCLKGPCVKLS